MYRRDRQKRYTTQTDSTSKKANKYCRKDLMRGFVVENQTVTNDLDFLALREEVVLL